MGVWVRERDGCWWVFITHQNRRKAKKIGPGPEGKRIATLLAQRITARLASGESLNGPTSVPLLRDYAEDWLRKVNVTKKTRHGRDVCPSYAQCLASRLREVSPRSDQPQYGQAPAD